MPKNNTLPCLRGAVVNLLSLALGIACLVRPAAGAEFYPITSISADTTDLFPVVNLIEGPGSGFSASEPHAATGDNWVTDAPGGFPSDYIAVDGMPVLTLDLGSDVLLSEISVWGYATSNGNGVSEISLRFATAAEGAGGFGSSIAFNPTFQPVIDDSPRQSFPFGQIVTARYVEFTCVDNFFGAVIGGDRVGLGEIAFENTIAQIDPRIAIGDTLALVLDGSVQTINVPVQNLGATQNLVVSNPTFSGLNAAAFSVIALPGPIEPATSANIELSFNPAGLSGNVSATLSIESNDTLSPNSDVSMSGFLHDPMLITSSALNFGVIAPADGVQSQGLAVANGGGGQVLNISSTAISGPDASLFSVASAPSNLAPLSSGSIDITFDPQGNLGSFSAQLAIATDDPVNPSVTVNLTAIVTDLDPNSGVRINEFMASNGQTIDDGDGLSNDWIEIFNEGPGAVDLAGWHLTDDSSDLTKWEFPSNTVIFEGGYLLVFASGQSGNNYVDAGGFLHTNFRLSAGGDYLALVREDGFTIASEFSPTFGAQFNDISFGTFQSGGSTLDVLEGTDAEVLVPPDGSLTTLWVQPSFLPDASWTTGPGRAVGYEGSGGAGYDPFITIDVESEMWTISSTAYIRVPFTLANSSAVLSLQLRMRYDDGFVAYLNGQEIAIRNAPASPVWNSGATGSHADSQAVVFEEIDVSEFIPELRNGTNVLAIHGLNSGAGSSDFLIEPQLIADLAGDGPLSYGYLLTATPGLPNAGGSATPGPEVTNVSFSPNQPSASDDIVVTAMVAPRLAPVTGINLTYRVGYGAEAMLAMADDGTGNDIAAGDGVFTATIPASAYSPEDMVRWFVRTTDTAGNAGRAPVFLDQAGNNQSPEYFGTVVADPSIVSQIPVFQWFTQSESASHNRSGARASVYFRGRFYDNVFVRQRGGATNGSVSQKFDFNKGDSLFIDDEMPAVGEINMNGNGSDGAYVRQPLAFESYRMAGNASCLSELWNMRINGDFDRVGVFIEQVDEDFLTRNGYDEDGDLYKFVQRSNLNPVFFDTVTGIEKKTGNKADLTSVQDLVAGLNQATSAQRRSFVIDHLDLPQVVNYLAVRSITLDADDVRKNFYGYFDARGDGRWRLFPWDKDWTFGVTGDGGTHLPHPFFGDQEHSKQNANQWNVLYDVLFEEIPTQRMYLRRLRTVMDTVLQNSSTPMANRYYENRAEEIFAPADPLLSSGVTSQKNSMLGYFPGRRTALENNYSSLIPASQATTVAVAIDSAEVNPASGNQDEEFIRLTTGENTEVDISGWTLEGGVTFTFAPGTVIPRNGELFVSPDTRAFLGRAVSPAGGEDRMAVGPYAGHLSNFGEQLTLKNESGGVVDTFMTAVQPTDPQQYLVISEIMYHPAPPDSDAEFIELMNISDAVMLDLGGVHFSAGIDFAFAPGTMLPPGGRILVVLDQAAFEAVHGAGMNIAGEFSAGTRFDNGGELIKLEDATNSTIAEFTYRDVLPWPTGADGTGFSLVLKNPGTRPNPDNVFNWRESSAAGGNPGGGDGVTFSGNPAADADRDTLNALLEHATGTSDAIPDGSPITMQIAGGKLVISVASNQAADDVTLSLEISADMSSWSAPAPESIALASTINNGDGTSILRYETNSAFLAANAEFFVRLRVDLLP